MLPAETFGTDEVYEGLSRHPSRPTGTGLNLNDSLWREADLCLSPASGRLLHVATASIGSRCAGQRLEVSRSNSMQATGWVD